MQVTKELLLGLGFVEHELSWSDDHCRLYKDQIPPTLKELKNVLTGKAFNKGKLAESRSATLTIQTLEDELQLAREGIC